jgi:hypothetical protein
MEENPQIRMMRKNTILSSLHEKVGDKMDEEKWKDLTRVASVVAEEVIEKKLDPVYDKDKIDGITKDRIAFFRKAKNIIERLRKEIDAQKEPDPSFCEEFKQFLTDLTEKNQRILFSTTLSKINAEVLGKFLKRYGIITWTEYPKNHSFETIVIIVPVLLDPRQVSEGEFVRAFVYIKIGDKIFDFDGNLFERLAKDLVHTDNIGGTDVSLRTEVGRLELDGGVPASV